MEHRQAATEMTNFHSGSSSHKKVIMEPGGIRAKKNNSLARGNIQKLADRENDNSRVNSN